MSDHDSTVIIRDIPGYPGYRAGTDGSIWSCWYCVSNGQYKGTRREMGDQWRQLKGSRDAAGYRTVSLVGVGNVRVHTLILITFVGPCPAGMLCRHFPDSDKSNNRLENLQWGTTSENMLDRNVHGTHNKGERNGMHKFSADLVRRIRCRHAELKGRRIKSPKGAVAALAAEFGLKPKQINYLVSNECWKELSATADA